MAGAHDVKRTETQGIQLIQLIRKSLRGAGLLLGVWGVGYFEFSLSWVLAALFGYVGWQEYQKYRKRKENDGKPLVKEKGPEALARVDELPSWVYFPDTERAEWLNKMIQQMWPYIGVYVRNLLKDTIEPLINKELTAISSHLAPFVFQKINIGSIPLRIGGVKVYIDNIKRDEIIMDMEVTFASDATLSVTLRSLPAGIRDLMIHGTVRVVVSPLVTKLPILGGFSFFFLNTPQIDFELTEVLNVLELPLLSASLRTVVSDVIANLLVLPNRITVPIINDIELQQFLQPEGVVWLHIVEARQLIKADIGIGAKSDPYCVVDVGEKDKFKTKVIDKTITPIWNEMFEFIVDLKEDPITNQKEDQIIKIEVFDEDKHSREDDKLGRVSLPVSDIIKAENRNVDAWLKLLDVKSGEIHIRAQWLYLSKDRDVYDNLKVSGVVGMRGSKAILFLAIDSAKDLPSSKKAMIEPSPFVRLEIGNTEKRTTAKKRTTNPNWVEQFTFFVADPDNQELILEVLDSSKMNSKLGVRKIPLHQLLNLTDMTESRPYPLKECLTQATITMRLCLRILTPESPGEDSVDGFDDSLPIVLPKLSSTPSPEMPKGVPDIALNTSRESSVSRGANNTASSDESPTGLRYRGPPTSANNDGRFGRIQLTLRYSTSNERFIAVVHKCVNLMPGDPHDNLADPYVRLVLIPDKSSSSKKKTATLKNNLSPVFDETFDWHVPKADILTKTLDITVKNSVGVFSKGRIFLGLLQLSLADFDDLTKPVTNWFDLHDPDSGLPSSNQSPHQS